MIQLLKASLAPSSRKSYLKAFVQFLHFLVQLGVQFPPDPLLLPYYIVSLHAKHLAPSSITTRLAALSFVFKFLGLPDPTKTFFVQRVMLGVRNLGGTGDTRLPITPSILAKLVTALPQVVNSMYLTRLYTAMFTLAFHAFLRVGEITFTNQETQCHILRNSSISPQPQGGVVVTFHSFKHSKGRTHHVSVYPSSGILPCAVTHLTNYLSVRGQQPGYLFLTPQGHPVSRSEFTKVLREAVAFCQLPTSIKSHSFRIGAASYAARIGRSDAQIRALGRWNSNAFLRYIR